MLCPLKVTRIIFVFIVIFWAGTSFADVYRKPIPSLPITFNPKYYSDAYSVLVSTQIYDKLFVLDELQSIKGSLAEKWESANGGKLWTIHLRKGILFHNGSPFTAQDVFFTLNKLLEADSIKSRELSIIVGADDYTQKHSKPIQGIKIIDPYTIQIELKQPFPPFLSILTGINTEIVPDNYAGKTEAEFFKHPVGTGPFKFISYEPDKNVTLEVNEKYFLGKPYIQKIVFEKSDSQNAIKGFNAGYYQDLECYPGVDLNLIKINYTMIKAPVAGVSTLYFNMRKPPFNNLHVRKAIEYALDKKQLVDICFPDRTPATGYVPSGVGGYYPEMTSVPFDLEKAKAELKISRLSAKELSKQITILRPSNHQCIEKFASFMESSFKKIGLNVSIKYAVYSEIYEHYYTNKDFDIINVIDFADHPEAIFLLSAFQSNHSHNITGIKSRQIDDILQKASATEDKYERFNLYRKLQEILQEEAIVIPIYYDIYQSVYQKNVRGVERSPYILYETPMRTIYFDKGDQK